MSLQRDVLLESNKWFVMRTYRMLINLIAKGFKSSIAENVKGFKSSIAEKVLDKDPEIIEDLFIFSKRAEST